MRSPDWYIGFIEGVSKCEVDGRLATAIKLAIIEAKEEEQKRCAAIALAHVAKDEATGAKYSSCNAGKKISKKILEQGLKP